MMTTVHTFIHGELIAFLVKGGLMMIPLLASSVLSLTVILERGFFWWRLRKPASTPMILQCVDAGDIAQAIELAKASRHPIARVLHAGLAYRERSPGAAMEAAAQAELSRVKAYLPVLDTIITLAPLLGLLGTITGMISAFGLVSEAGLGQTHAITGGVAEALIATATGLCIAIMTLIPYNYFRSKIEQLTGRMEEQATRLELSLSRAGLKANG